MTRDDRTIIERAIDDWLMAWRTGDAALAARLYTEDADWTNAFGVSCRGRAEIQATLETIFSSPNVMAGRDSLVRQEVRFVVPDVAVAKTFIERTGQLSDSGESLGVRHTSHLRVFIRGEHGWQIVSHLISDART